MLATHEAQGTERHENCRETDEPDCEADLNVCSWYHTQDQQFPHAAALSLLLYAALYKKIANFATIFAYKLMVFCSRAASCVPNAHD